MNKTEFLATLQKARAEWDSLLAQFPGDVTLPSGWSLKDVIAHIAWYEREMVGVLKARALVGSPWWNMPLDERNALIFEENRGLSWPEAVAESQRVYQQLLDGLQSLTDEELADAKYFAEMPPDWIPWQVIASNCFEHYPQHIPDLQAWLEMHRERG